jgi:hypothetical protein
LLAVQKQQPELTVLPILAAILLNALKTITRTVDVTPPSITCAAPPVLTCNQTVPAPDVTTVTATDACGTPTVTFVSDVTNLVGVQKQQPELTVLLILAAILLNALKLLQGL